MAEVTVSELAKSVGAPVERLLKQMQEAGLKQKTADAVVSDEEKQKLLDFLKTSHGEASGEPKKITLQRKTTTTLKTGSGSARKTVNVEVRKKRTYVKREEVEDQSGTELDAVQENEELQQEPQLVVEAPVEEPTHTPEPEPEISEETPVVEAAQADADAAGRSSFTDGIEEKRRAAQERRMA